MGFYVHIQPAAPHPVTTAAGGMDVQMFFGAAAVVLMFFCRSQQDRIPLMVIGTIVFGFMAGVYGFMVGAWPLGMAEIVYTVLAYKRWLQSRRRAKRYRNVEWNEESRVSRLFGRHQDDSRSGLTE